MITAPTTTSSPTCASTAPRAARPRLAVRAAAAAANVVAAMAPTKIHYFAIRGRAEPARLILAAVGAEWEDVVPDWGTMKSDAALYPFGQLPVMEDGGVLVSQSNAMIRHLGRKHALAGAGLAQQAAVDVLLDGAEAIKAKYLNLIYADEASDAAKAAYWSTHVAADSAAGNVRNGGAHFGYLERVLAAAGGGATFALGAEACVADFVIADLCENHGRLFGAETFAAEHPRVAALAAAVFALPGVAAYAGSARRPAKVNNSVHG